MIEIIPNWHPFLVHFTIGLLLTGTVLYLIALIAGAKLPSGAYIAAIWLIFIGAGFTVLTLLAGWQAFQTVAHDGPSHLTMLSHRRFALLTAGALLMALVLLIFQKDGKRFTSPSALVAIALLLMSGLLLVTGYKGSELVFRHGLGVQSLPHKGTHDHGESSAHNHEDKHQHEHSSEYQH